MHWQVVGVCGIIVVHVQRNVAEEMLQNNVWLLATAAEFLQLSSACMQFNKSNRTHSPCESTDGCIGAWITGQRCLFTASTGGHMGSGAVLSCFAYQLP